MQIIENHKDDPDDDANRSERTPVDEAPGSGNESEQRQEWQSPVVATRSKKVAAAAARSKTSAAATVLVEDKTTVTAIPVKDEPKDCPVKNFDGGRGTSRQKWTQRGSRSPAASDGNKLHDEADRGRT
jgi:hypothetical protein